MRRIFTTARFEKRLKAFLSLHPDLSDEIEATMIAMVEFPQLPPGYRPHRLKGYLAGCYAIRLSYEYRIVFVPATGRITFIDIGTHDDVYR